jgi:serine/threonine protein kinase
MSAQPITFTYPTGTSCTVNIDFEGKEYTVRWDGDWKVLPDLQYFPNVSNATVTLVPHTSSVNEIWATSQVLKFGADAHLRVLHSCTDEFPICKVALDVRQRRLLQEEFSILRQLSSQDVPVVRTHYQALVDEEGIFGFRMERLAAMDMKIAAKYIPQIRTAVNKIHKCGIVHHDLSPSNMMLNQKGFITLIDFGRAGYIGEEIPRDKLIGSEPTKTVFSIDADLLRLNTTIGTLSPAKARLQLTINS